MFWTDDSALLLRNVQFSAVTLRLSLLLLLQRSHIPPLEYVSSPALRRL